MEDQIDLDALLDAQSSDEEGGDLPELGRSIDDILNDAYDDGEQISSTAIGSEQCAGSEIPGLINRNSEISGKSLDSRNLPKSRPEEVATAFVSETGVARSDSGIRTENHEKSPNFGSRTDSRTQDHHGRTGKQDNDDVAGIRTGSHDQSGGIDSNNPEEVAGKGSTSSYNLKQENGRTISRSSTPRFMENGKTHSHGALSAVSPLYQLSPKPSLRPGAALAAATASSRRLGSSRLDHPPPRTDSGGPSIVDSSQLVTETKSKEVDGFDEVHGSKTKIVQQEDMQKSIEVMLQEQDLEGDSHQDNKRERVATSENMQQESSSSYVSVSGEGSVSPPASLMSESDESSSEAFETVDVTDDDLDAVEILSKKHQSGATFSESSDDENLQATSADENVDSLGSSGDGTSVNTSSSMPQSPLDAAEELEKRAASTGLHLEEGAAAYRMQLEGIQRGPPAIGLLQLDWRNALSFALSSPTIVREHVTARALAVHSNFIAVGMSDGSVVLAPSKYSAATTADDNDSKVVHLNSTDKSKASVSVLCFSHLGDMLLAGYSNGTVTLWEITNTKPSIIKPNIGEHQNAIVHAAFVAQEASTGRQLKALTADCRGFVMVHSFTNMIFLRRLSVSSHVIMDGIQTGIVLSLSSLIVSENILNKICPIGQADAGKKYLYEGFSSEELGGLIVFGSSKNVIVLRLVPAIQCASMSRPEGVREGSIPYTSWRRTTSEDNTYPLLAVAWGKKVHILRIQKAEFKTVAQWEIDSKAAGIAWLNEQMVVVATTKAELWLFTKEGTELERTTVRDQNGHAESLTFHTYFLETCNNPEKVFANSTGVRGAAFYFLGASRLWRARLLPWQDRIKALQDAGDWMGAFQIAMELFDGRARGVTGLPTGLNAMQQAIMPNLLALLSSYVEEAFAYVRLSLGTPEEYNEIATEQYARVGRVAIEFCLHINRTDVLFDNVFRKFNEVKQAATFLELLEPYILKDMLCGLAPEIMQSLVEHYSIKGWLQRVEQCILHMDIASLDFNQVMRLCRDHGLFSALIYLFNKGLNDFKSPLDELLAAAQNEHRQNAQYFGYKLLVYLKYCFSGLAFPPGRGSLPSEQLPQLKSQLLEYLLDPAGSGREAESVYAVFPRLHYLLNLDVVATLDVFKLALEDTENYLVQSTVDALVHIVETVLCMDVGSKSKTGYILRFIAHYVSAGSACIPPTTLLRILDLFLDTSQDVLLPEQEDLTVLLLRAVPDKDWDPDSVLELAEKAHFWQVSALVYTRKQDYISALDSYLKDTSRPVNTFCYVISTLDSETGLKEDALDKFRNAVISRIPQLIQHNSTAALYVVLEYFKDQVENVIQGLNIYPTSLFSFMRAIMEVQTSLEEKSVDNEPWTDRKRLANLLESSHLVISDETVEQYIELMCKYEPESVLSFLNIHENYRLEQCLKLCQKYGVNDAAAFLLERVGDVGSALTLILEKLSKYFHDLDAAIALLSSSSTSQELPEGKALHSVKDAAISLCQRNTYRLDPQEAESLWFHLLDRFIHPLQDLVSSKQKITLKQERSSHYDWRVLHVDGRFVILRNILSKFAGDIVTGMIGYIPLQNILNKIISDHGKHELGDFKATILEMLNAHGFEVTILGTAKKIMEADMFHNVEALKRGRARGFSPKTPRCAVCDCYFIPDESLNRKAVQIFSCGHFTHTDCIELPDSQKTKWMCPVCLETGAAPVFDISENVEKGKAVAEQPPREATIRLPSRRLDGISRFELLKRLERGESLPEMTADLRWNVSPPIVYRHRSMLPSANSSSNGNRFNKRPFAGGGRTKKLQWVKLDRN